MERFRNLEQARIGLLAITVVELFAGALDFGLRLVPPEALGNGWLYEVYAALSFLLSVAIACGLAVMASALTDQLLGWTAAGLIALDALVSVAGWVVPGGGHWIAIGGTATFVLSSAALLMACSLAASHLAGWLPPLAAGYSFLCLGSGAWSVLRVLADEKYGDASPTVKAIRLGVSLLVFSGLVGVPAIAWVATGRLAPPPTHRPGW